MPTVSVDQAKLVLNSFAAIFENNLLTGDLVTWKKFDQEFNDRNGLEVVEQVTPDYTTTFTTNAVADLTAGTQDSNYGSERYKLTQVVGSSMGWADFVKIRDINEARESKALEKAALRLATDIDAYVLRFAATASNNWLGDGSTGISTFDHVASGYTRLKAEGVMDPEICAVLSYNDKQSLGSTVVANNASLEGMGTDTYRKSFSGDVAGVPTMFTQQLPALTVGTRVAAATTQTDYAAGTFVQTYPSVAISPAAGQYCTSLINLKGQTGAVTLVDGEVFTIAGVFAWDNRAKKQLPHLQQFRVIGNYTAAAGVFTGVRIFPAPIATGPFQNIVNTNGGGATVNNLAVTHLGAAGATLQPRFLADKSAIVVHTADLITPATGIGSRMSLKKVPISVRMWQNSNFLTGAHDVRFDIALEANVAADGRRKLCRING